jgi:hypothetical protein
MQIGGRSDPRIEELLRACVDAVGVDGGGLSVVSDTGVREPVFGSDDTAVTMESLQVTLGEGPCVDASVSGAPVLIADLADHSAGVAERWPVFLAEAASVGVRAVFAFPVTLGALSFGVVDLYRSSPGALEWRDLAKVLSVVDAIALVLLDGGATVEMPVVPERLSHMVVHQAAGMVMVQIGSSLEDAMIRLRAAAFSDGISVQELAEAVVRGERRFREEEE